MTRSIWVAGIIGLIVLAFGMERALAQEPAPGSVYAGTLADSTGECSTGSFTLGAAFSFTIAEYGSGIRNLHVTGLTLAGFFTSPTSFDVPANIPIASDGSFSQDFTAYSIADVHIDGRFQGTGVSGSFRISALGEVWQGTFQAQLTAMPAPTAQTFHASIPLVDGCGGGTLSMTRAANLLSITSVSVEGFVANGQTFSGSATFPEGTVPVDAATGAFGWVYFPGRQSGQEIAINGAFAGTQVNGLIAVSPSTCDPVAFSGNTLVPVPAGGRGGGLPPSGAGRSGGGLPVLPVSALLASGLVLIVGGKALRRHLR